jgi:hypothetical protein
MVAALGGDARAAAAPKPALNVAKLTKAEEAIFTLQPGKDAFVKLAQALTPFRPVVDHVADALSWRSTRKAMAAQAAFAYAVLYPYVIIPGILLTLGMCTLTNRKEEEESGDEDDGETNTRKPKPKTPAPPKGTSWRSKARKMDAISLQRFLEDAATKLERVIALTTWEDPVVTGAFCAGCLIAALVLTTVSFQTVVLCLGLSAMRPPSWRVVPGPLTSLLGRMPDKGEEYARLMQENGGGGKVAASGA